MTLHPNGQPSLILKLATDCLALVTTGFCPDITVRLSNADSRCFLSFAASPTPIFMTTFVNFGTAIIFDNPNSSLRAGLNSWLYFSFKLAIT